MTDLLYSLLAVFIVSALSLIGIFFFPFKGESLKKVLNFFVSVATGVMLGDAFLHLLPDIYERYGLETRVALFILLGIIIFFSLEKFVKWRHCHEPDCEEHNHSLATNNIVGETLHNLLDGAIIAGSFFASPALGVTTTLAVVAHEIPHEVGNFAVLLHSGLDKRKALTYNMLSALAAFVGVGLVGLIGPRINNFYLFILPLTVGGFIYVAGSDLVPELHRETRLFEGVNQLLGLILGILIMLIMV
jgi:zinc and cadmium transporter